MSLLEVNKITPQSGTTLVLGDSGDTINFGSGVLPNFENLTVTGDLTVDTDSLYVDSANNVVGIGTTSTTVTSTSLRNLVIADYADTASGIVLKATTASALSFEDVNTSTAGRVYYNHATNYMAFNTNASEAMRIDSSGNLLVGKTSSSGSIAGAELRAIGRIFGTSDANAPLFLNRLTSDGTIATFRKDGNEIGTISSNAGNMEIDTTKGAIGHSANDIVIYSKDAGHNGLRMHTNGILPTDNTGTIIDNDADLGEASYRFKDLYLGGTITFADSHKLQNDAFDNLQILASSGEGMKLTTQSNSDVVFETNNNERMRVTGTGNVGIGTTSPTENLHVYSTSNADMMLETPTAGADARFFIKRNGSTSRAFINFQDSGTAATWYTGLLRNTGTTFAIGQGDDFGTNTRFVIDSNGNVGIGTTSPAERLDVNSDIKGSRFYSRSATSGSSTNIPVTTQGDGYTITQMRSKGNTTDAVFIEFDGLNPGGSNQSNSWIGAQYNGNWSSNLVFFAGKKTNTAINNYDSAKVAQFNQDAITFNTGTAGASDTSERMRIDSSGRVGIGETSMDGLLVIKGDSNQDSNPSIRLKDGSDTREAWITNNAGDLILAAGGNDNVYHSRIDIYNGDLIIFYTGGAQRGKWKTDRFLVSASGNDIGGSNVGGQIETAGTVSFNRSNFVTMFVQRRDSDGSLVDFVQDGTTEGSISVSGATVSYNGFTGTHWSRLTDNSKPTILKGTILESLDEMMDWYQVHFTIQEEGKDDVQMEKSYVLQEGESVGDVITYNHEGTDYQATIVKESDVKHSKAKVSDTSESKAVYGVFVDWDNDDDTVNDMYVAQTGTFVVRMNGAETVSKGDLIQSNGDGTGKVQADDIIRASTVAKVLSTTKIETYDDGSYIVPCSLHC